MVNYCEKGSYQAFSLPPDSSTVIIGSDVNNRTADGVSYNHVIVNIRSKFRLFLRRCDWLLTLPLFRTPPPIGCRAELRWLSRWKLSRRRLECFSLIWRAPIWRTASHSTDQGASKTGLRFRITR
jgi:hypothetical protein